MIDASGELERLPATVAGLMPRLSVTRDKADKILRLNQSWVPQARSAEPPEAEAAVLDKG